MKETVNKLEELLILGKNYISKSSETELNQKANPEKWSKKEITGHLIDSGINNLQRFTEIQFETKPYTIRSYNQAELVKANEYQNAEIKEITDLLWAINMQIKRLMLLQTPQTLNYKIELPDGKISDLRFLMKDYVDHFEHHINQIIKPWNR